MTDDPERWSRITALFHDAQERPSEERGVFLDQACAGDSTLRAEVEALLAADSTAGGFLAGGPRVASLLLDEEPAAIPAGSMLGAYRVLRVLGRASRAPSR
jgi:hypothetical protein